MNTSGRESRMRYAAMTLALTLLGVFAHEAVRPTRTERSVFDAPVTEVFPVVFLPGDAEYIANKRPSYGYGGWRSGKDGFEEISAELYGTANSEAFSYSSFVQPVHPCCVSMGADRHDCFFRIIRATLSHLTQYKGQPPKWENIGGKTRGHIGCESWGPNHIFVYGLALNQTLIGRSLLDGVWGEWQTLPMESLNEIPACTVLAPGVVHCIGRKTDNTPITMRYAKGQWKERQVPHQLLETQVACVRRQKRRIECFSTGVDAQLKHLSWTPQKLWGPWESLGGRCSGAPSVVTTRPLDMNVFVNSSLGRLSSIHWDGSSWSDWNLYSMWSPVLMTDAECVTSIGNRIDCFAGFKPDGRLHRIAWNGRSWSRWKVYQFNIYATPFCRFFEDHQIWCLVWAKPPKWTLVSFDLIDMPVLF